MRPSRSTAGRRSGIPPGSRSTPYAENIHLFSGRPDRAIPIYLKALETEPSHGLSRFFLGQAYLAAGQSADAISELRRANQAMGEAPFAASGLGHALARAGQHEEAREILAELMRRRQQGYYPAFAIATVHAGLGDHAAALEWLARAVDERHHPYYAPSIDPVWDPLRSDPRFEQLLRRMNLPE